MEKLLSALEQRVNALEEKVASLEAKLAGGAEPKNRITISSYVRFGPVSCRRERYFFLPDGRKGYSLWRTDTIAAIRKVADSVGLKYDAKTKREVLGYELVSKYGDGDWAVIGSQVVNAQGETWQFIDSELPYDVEAVGAYTSKEWLEGEDFINEPMVIDPDWSPEKIAEELLKFSASLARKPKE